MNQSNPKGRGSGTNPANRFVLIDYEPDPEAYEADAPPIKTQYFRDTSRSIIARNDSPDVSFDASINPYRGCEHGCAYCYARPTHEYLGLSAGLDFETLIFVKEDAPELLRKELSKASWTPRVLALSGVTDPYQPVERRLKLTRRCLEVLSEFRNPVQIITKNALVTRDIDLLANLAEHNAAAVSLSITTMRQELQRRFEPRTSAPHARFDAVRALADASIPVNVMMAPIIPGLTDHEIPSILKAASEAGARKATYIVLRLPHGVKELMENWLEEHEPNAQQKVLNKVKELFGGKLYDPAFGKRHRGMGKIADQIEQMFQLYARKYAINAESVPLNTSAFQRPHDGQLRMFD